MRKGLDIRRADEPSTREIQLTSGGRVVTSVAVIAVVAGVTLRWVEPFILGVGCLLGLLVELPGVLRSRQIEVERRLKSRFVPTGTRVEGDLTIVNQSERSTPRQLVRQTLAGTPVDVEVDVIKPGATSVCDFAMPPARRGVLELSPAMVSRAGLFGLIRDQSPATLGDVVVIHPRYRMVDVFPGGFTTNLEGPSYENSPAGGITFHAVRPYEIGDDIRHIHWMTTARAGDLMVRQYVDTRVPTVFIDVDTSAASYASPEDFDVALECAASIGASFAQAHGEITLRLGGADVEHLDQHTTTAGILRDLATAELGDQVPGFRATNRENAAVKVQITGDAIVERRSATSVPPTADPSVVRLVVGTAVSPPDAPPNIKTIHVADLDDFLVAWRRTGV